MATTTNYSLPLIDGSATANVPRDVNALATAVDTALATTGTSAATPNTTMKRDNNGRSKVAAPAVSDDIARKDTVDAAITTAAADATTKANGVQTNLTAHIGTGGSAHAAVTTATAGFASAADKVKIEAANTALTAAAATPITLNQGVAAYTASRRSRLRINKMAGRTLVNLWGRLGNFSALAGLSISNSTGIVVANGGVDGRNALTVTNTSSNPFVYVDIASAVGGGRYYITIVNAKLGTAPDAQIGLASTGFGTTVTSYGTANTAGFTPIYRKIAVTGNGTGFRVGPYTSASTVGQTVQFDGFRIYEITAAEYAAIDTMTAAQVAAKWPYVDDMKHINAVSISNAGKNLLPPFSEWSLQSGAIVIDPYAFNLNAAASGYNNPYFAPVIPGATYRLTVGINNANSVVYTRFRDSSNAIISSGASLTPASPSATYVMPSNCVFFEVIPSSSAAGLISFSNPQLELGTSSTTFEPKRGSYLYLPDCRLPSNADGSVADSLYTDGQGRLRVMRQFREVVLDGSFTWGLSLDKVGYKIFSILWSTTGLPLGFEGSSKLRAIKYNGNPLATSYSVDTVDTAYFSASSANFAVSVPDSDTGFGEDYAPSSAEIKAFYFGWKMNNGTFGTPYNGSGTKTWTRWDATNNTGAVTITPTDYAASTYTPYRLMYQLAVSVDEPINYEGDLLLHEGGNQIEVGTGIVPRELAKPTLNGSSYAINNNADKPASNLLYRTDKILSVYRGSSVDKKWLLITDANAYGRQRLAIASADFDPSSSYSIAYLALDTHSIGIAPLTLDAEYASNVKESDDSVQRAMTDTRTQLSVTDTRAASHAADTSHIPFAVATGSVNAYVVNVSPAPTAYIAGMALAVQINITNTGATTINVNGLGAKSVLNSKGAALIAGKFVANVVYTLRYNGSAFTLQGEGGDYGTAVASQVLTGTTIGTDNGIVSGTMPNIGTVAITPSTASQAIAAGYHNGLGSVAGDANLLAANILSGKSIFGVAGTVIAGKRSATGTASSGTATLPFKRSDASADSNFPSITVSGLSFVPSIVILSRTTNTYATIFKMGILPPMPYTSDILVIIGGGNYCYYYDGVSAYVTSAGFRLPVGDYNGAFTWTAIE